MQQSLKFDRYNNDFQVGNIVTLGNYCGPIKWQVLEVKDKKALLISKHILFRMAFDTQNVGTWKTSSLRKFLNENFYENCFTKAEKSRIDLSKISVNSGDTEDRLFLLSIDEVNEYFNSDRERIAASLDGQESSWCLRCRGDYDNYAAFVFRDGCVDYGGGYSAGRDDGGVRVALQWNLES